MFKTIFTFVPFALLPGILILFLAPAGVKTRGKAVWAMALLLCAAKFMCFEAFGGDAFAPELPDKVIWAWNFAYSGMCILFGLSLACLPARFVVRRLLALRGGRLLWLVGLPAIAWGAAAVGEWNGLRAPELVEIELSFENLPESLDGYRIVQLTDMHASASAARWRTEAVVERANSANADLICLTGDYADGMPGRQARNAEPLKNLRAKDGVLAVSGNHEYYYNWYGWRALYRKWGIEFLENRCAFPREGLAVAGVPDCAGERIREDEPDPDAAFAAATNGEFRVLLQHRPRIDFMERLGREMHERCDLQLSGHTHGGVAPVMASVVAAFNGGMVRGVYRGADGRTVYVSSGAGQWEGFPMRFFNDPEIPVIVLRRAKGGAKEGISKTDLKQEQSE